MALLVATNYHQVEDQMCNFIHAKVVFKSCIVRTLATLSSQTTVLELLRNLQHFLRQKENADGVYLKYPSEIYKKFTK